MILYRWRSRIKGAEQLPWMVAKLLALSLEGHGHNMWMDRKDLSIASPVLKQAVLSQMEEKKLAVISIGVGDLQRCSAVDDFCRLEIDHARQLENRRNLLVAVVVHETNELTDLVCGRLGKWGRRFTEILKKPLCDIL